MSERKDEWAHSMWGITRNDSKTNYNFSHEWVTFLNLSFVVRWNIFGCCWFIPLESNGRCITSIEVFGMYLGIWFGLITWSWVNKISRPSSATIVLLSMRLLHGSSFYGILMLPIYFWKTSIGDERSYFFHTALSWPSNSTIFDTVDAHLLQTDVRFSMSFFVHKCTAHLFIAFLHRLS